MENAKTTLVSAFVPLQTKNRGLDTYLALGSKWMSVAVPKIVFVPADLIPALPEHASTVYVPFAPSFPQTTCRLPSNRNPNKDTQEYMLVMHWKTNFVQTAILKNPFQSQQFVWVDFGIAHVCDPSTFERDILALGSCDFDRVRIGRIWDLTNVGYTEDRILWYFAGGVFGGPKSKLLQFAEAMQQESQKLLERKVMVWEVNVWAKIFAANRELFDPYVCNHDPTILRHYPPEKKLAEPQK